MSDEFARALRVGMKAKGMNASALARAVWGEITDSRGYKVARNRDRIGHYLEGKSFPEDANLHKIADALGLPYAQLAATRPAPRLVAASAGISPLDGSVGDDTQLTVLRHKPGYAILQLKLCMPVQTAIKILELACDAQPPHNRTT